MNTQRLQRSDKVSHAVHFMEHRSLSRTGLREYFFIGCSTIDRLTQPLVGSPIFYELENIEKGMSANARIAQAEIRRVFLERFAQGRHIHEQ